MIGFNDKAILPATLLSPELAFDPDYNTLKIKNRDYRDNPVLEYNLNENGYMKITDNKIINYSLPVIDVEYDISYKATPRNTKYKMPEIITTKIFSNDEKCKYFKYSGDDYNSSDICKYIGTDNNVVIPKKHNLVNTTSATILGFPNVTSKKIQVTTPVYMTDFNIRDERITEFTVKNGSINPIENQFGSFTNLTNINGNFIKCSDYMFANNPVLNMNPSNTKDMVNIGKYAFYDTPLQRTIRVSAESIEKNMFDGDTEKVIFTSSEYINGYSPKTIVKYKFPYSRGYHQLYNNVKDPIWKNETPNEESIVEVVHYNSTGKDELFEGLTVPKECIVLKSNDVNIMGMKFETRRAGGTNIGEGLFFPVEYYSTYRSIPNWCRESNPYKYFVAYWSYFYGDDENSALSLIPYSTDIIYTTPIGRDGILKTTSRKTITGEIPVIFHLSETTALTLNTNDTHVVTAISDFEESIVWSSTDTSIVSIEEVTNKEVILTAHKSGRVTISATIVSGEKTYTRSFYVNVLTTIEILPDTETATQELLLAAAAVNTSSYTRYDIDAKGGMLMGSSLGSTSKYWMLWIKKDLDKDIVGVIYDKDGNEVMFLDLAQYAGPTYTYSNSQAFNLGAFQDALTTDHYLKCWYKNNPSFGCFRINLTNKISYTGTEEPIYDELPDLN